MIRFPQNFELKFEITERCNSRCSFCHQGYGKLLSWKEIKFSQVERWLRWACEQGITAIRFTGGEPLLHPQLKKMAEFASRQGFYVTVNSNGLISEKRYDVLSPFIDMYKISLPAADEDTVDRLTGVKGAFRKKIVSIQHLNEHPRQP